jgi:stress-induced morphogen
MNLTTELEQKLAQAFPGAQVIIESPDQVHFNAVIRAPQFKGLSRIAQHQRVYTVLDDLISSGTVHALSLKTEVLE